MSEAVAPVPSGRRRKLRTRLLVAMATIVGRGGGGDGRDDCRVRVPAARSAPRSRTSRTRRRTCSAQLLQLGRVLREPGATRSADGRAWAGSSPRCSASPAARCSRSTPTARSPRASMRSPRQPGSTDRPIASSRAAAAPHAATGCAIGSGSHPRARTAEQPASAHGGAERQRRCRPGSPSRTSTPACCSRASARPGPANGRAFVAEPVRTGVGRGAGAGAHRADRLGRGEPGAWASS